MTDVRRFPNEPLVKFYNRRLAARGISDRRWCQRPDGSLYLDNSPSPQGSMDLGDGR